MTIDEAIKHAEEVAEEEEKQAIWLRSREGNPNYKNCVERAEEHRQLAEWLKELKQLREQTRWIPVSERLPEAQKNGDKDYSDWVQVTIDIGRNGDNNVYVCEAYYCFSENKWYTKRFVIGVVTAWMPLPKPYKMESEG